MQQSYCVSNQFTFGADFQTQPPEAYTKLLLLKAKTQTTILVYSNGNHYSEIWIWGRLCALYPFR